MAKKVNKRFQELLKKIDKEKKYSVDEALANIKNLASAKFDETIEIALKLNVDPRHADQMVTGSVVVPSGTGKTVSVAVIAKDEKAYEAFSPQSVGLERAYPIGKHAGTSTLLFHLKAMGIEPNMETLSLMMPTIRELVTNRKKVLNKKELKALYLSLRAS